MSDDTRQTTDVPQPFGNAEQISGSGDEAERQAAWVTGNNCCVFGGKGE